MKNWHPINFVILSFVKIHFQWHKSIFSSRSSSSCIYIKSLRLLIIVIGLFLVNVVLKIKINQNSFHRERKVRCYVSFENCHSIFGGSKVISLDRCWHQSHTLTRSTDYICLDKCIVRSILTMSSSDLTFHGLHKGGLLTSFSELKKNITTPASWIRYLQNVPCSRPCHIGSLNLASMSVWKRTRPTNIVSKGSHHTSSL